MAETRAATMVEEICAQKQWDGEAVLKLRSAVRNNVSERKALQSYFNSIENSGLSKDEQAARQAASAWILGRAEKAEAAAKGLHGAVGSLVRGELALARHDYEEAISQLQHAVAAAPKSAKLAAELAAALRAGGKIQEAAKLLAHAENNGLTDGELCLQQGWLAEAQGEQEIACNAYEKALRLDPQNAQATFRLAYYLDLRGEDDRAIELYKRVTGQGSAFVNAMVNLALLYEDKDDMDNAIACLKEALRVDPSNRRAALYLRDAVESLDMYYDETQRKESDRLEAILRTPINDFELSVRSRNCLAKMNVKTLGDIVRKTESELLTYKNFGETSLREIKQLLESKGLRLGMHKEDEEKRARVQRLRLGAPENSLLARPITDLELSVRARKCMQRLNIETIMDLIDKTEAELLATKNFGQTSLNEVKAKLSEANLALKTVE